MILKKLTNEWEPLDRLLFIVRVGWEAFRLRRSRPLSQGMYCPELVGMCAPCSLEMPKGSDSSSPR